MVIARSGVERIVLGTVALGLAYGLPGPGGEQPAGVDDATAISIIRAARTAGITNFDTAPAYGEAERRLGAGLSGDAQLAVWTKLDHRLRSGPGLVEGIATSLADSLLRLGRARIDLLQWHNWQAALQADADFVRAWHTLRDDPRIARLGASTYGVDDALAAVTSGLFAVVQVEWNLLNQHVIDRVASAARQRGVRLAVRSVFLQGVLTPRGAQLPPRLAGLALARDKAIRAARDRGLDLADLALLAALGHPGVDHVLVGVDAMSQLDAILRSAAGTPIDPTRSDDLRNLDLAGAAIADPRTWS